MTGVSRMANTLERYLITFLNAVAVLVLPMVLAGDAMATMGRVDSETGELLAERFQPKKPGKAVVSPNPLEGESNPRPGPRPGFRAKNRAELRVYIDPETGEFTAPEPTRNQPQSSGAGIQRQPSVGRVVERPHPHPDILGVVEVPIDLFPEMTEKSLGARSVVGCD